MKLQTIIAAGVLMLSATTVKAQDLIIRIDDLGSFHSANVACIDSYKNGISTSVEVMPTCSWYPEAVKMLKENPGLDAGVHLTITSEWENVKWGPLTDCPSLVDENGYFYPMMGPNKAYPGQSVLEVKPSLQDVEKEFRAQIELTKKHIPQLTHISGHMGSTRFTKEVYELTLKLAEEYGLPLIDRANDDLGLNYFGYGGPHATLEEKVDSFIKALDKLEKGKTYVFLDHPAYNDSEMQTVGHIGYEHVAVDRQGVTDLLKSQKVREAIEAKGIRLISFADHFN
jgi:predicted glycoside hydrolase/deacetylase ChbG (UPF0249 family)